jgi:hypothetical protein
MLVTVIDFPTHHNLRRNPVCRLSMLLGCGAAKAVSGAASAFAGLAAGVAWSVAKTLPRAPASPPGAARRPLHTYLRRRTARGQRPSGPLPALLQQVCISPCSCSAAFEYDELTSNAI